MDFKDFNEIDFLTIKTDFILEMSSGAENINDVIIRIKDMNIDYDTMFVTVLKAVETLRGHITEDIIEKVIIAIKDIITPVITRSDLFFFVALSSTISPLLLFLLRSLFHLRFL